MYFYIRRRVFSPPLNVVQYKSIFEYLTVCLYGNMVVFIRRLLGVTDYLCVDSVLFRGVYHHLGVLFGTIYLHSVTHIEVLIHLTLGNVGIFGNSRKQRRYFEKVVLYVVDTVSEILALSLSAARAMYHSVYGRAVIVEYLLDYGSVCTCG